MTLASALAQAAPHGSSFSYYHLQTRPQKTKSLWTCAKPPATTVEKHLLILLQNNIFAYALELLIFSTSRLRIYFVSKADSTGYARGIPVSDVFSAFLSHLLETQPSSDIETRLCLFARAQSQYIFLGSAENPGKHILDDYGLIKWWMRIFDRIDGCSPPMVIVPGLSDAEMKRLLPSSRWNIGHGYDNDALAREIIPYFPDDPKARFLDEIIIEDRPVNIQEFWDTMAFRQECSLGRLTGFLRMNTACGTSVQNVDGIVVEDKVFDRIFDLLHKQDYSLSESALSATAQWISNVDRIIGRSVVEIVAGQNAKKGKSERTETVNVLTARKKRK